MIFRSHIDNNTAIGEATITGLEWFGSAKIGTLSYVFIIEAMISGNNSVTDDPLPQLPATQNWIGLHYRDANDRFFVHPEFLIVGEQNDVAPNEITTPGCSIINLIF